MAKRPSAATPEATEASTDEKPKPKAPKGPLWTDYKCTWKFPGGLYGSVPQKQELVRDWLMSRMPAKQPEGTPGLEDLEAEVTSTLSQDELVQAEMSKVTLGFQEKDGFLVMRGATIRSHLKECARIVGKMYLKKGAEKGDTGIGWRVTNGLYVREHWVRITRPGGDDPRDTIQSREIMVHAQTMRGPINALKVVQYVEDVQMEFTLRLLAGVTRAELETILEYGQIHGYAGERSMGEGRYEWTLEEIA